MYGEEKGCDLSWLTPGTEIKYSIVLKSVHKYGTDVSKFQDTYVIDTIKADTIVFKVETSSEHLFWTGHKTRDRYQEIRTYNISGELSFFFIRRHPSVGEALVDERGQHWRCIDYPLITNKYLGKRETILLHINTDDMRTMSWYDKQFCILLREQMIYVDRYGELHRTWELISLRSSALATKVRY